MTPSLKPILLRMILIGAAVSLAFFAITQGFQYFWGDHFFQKRFETFEVGNSRFDVVGLLGKPDAAADEYALDEAEGFREDYRIGKHRGSKEYLFWYRGNFVFVIGLDASGQVTLAVSGSRL